MNDLDITQLQEIIRIQNEKVETLKSSFFSKKEGFEKEFMEKYRKAYGNSDRYLDVYRQGYITISPLAKEVSKLESEYDANMKLLVDAKALLISKIETEKLEVEDKIQSIRAKIATLSLDISNFDSSLEKIKEERRKLVSLNNKLEELNSVLNSIILTDEELVYRERQLSHEEDKIYNDSIGKLIDQVKNSTKTTVKIEETKEENIEIIIAECKEYERKFLAYERLLDVYFEMYDNFVELEKKLNNGEIRYSKVYEKAALELIRVYNMTETAYQRLLESRSKLLIKIGDIEKIKKYYNELNEEFKKEYQFRVHEENGLEEHLDDDLLDKIRVIGSIKDLLDKDVLRPDEPAILSKKKSTPRPPKPIPPRPIPDPIPPVPDPVPPEPEEPFEFTDLDALIKFIRGGGDQSFKWYDNFVYTTEKAKVWNWHKTKERTFADKPFKLVRTALGSLVVGGSKLLGKMVKGTGDVSKRIEICKKQVEKLSDSQLMTLLKTFSASRDKERYSLPKVVRNIIDDRLTRFVQEKIETYNLKIQDMYFKLIEDYTACDAIVKKLNGELSKTERKKLEREKSEYDSSLLKTINNLIGTYAEADNFVNQAGAAGMKNNIKFRKSSIVGGRNSSSKDHPLAANLTGSIGALLDHYRKSSKDGYSAAAMFLYKQKAIRENDTKKRTLKNRFGLANVGAYEWTPYVETIDYTEYEYSKDVLMTIVTVTSILSVVNQIKQAKVIAQLQSQNAALAEQYNSLAVNYNTLVDDYNKLSAWATQVEKSTADLMSAINRGGDELAEQLETMIRTFPGELHGSTEYFAMHAQTAHEMQAGITSSTGLHSSGDIYKSIDNTLHDSTSSLVDYGEEVISTYGNAPVDTKIKQYLDCLQKMADEAKNYAGLVEAGNQAYMTINSSFDYTAIAALFENINAVNPSCLINVVNAIKESAASLTELVKNMPSAVVQAVNTVVVTPVTNMTTLIPAVATLVGCGVLDAAVPEVKHILSDTVSLKDTLGQKLDAVEIDIHEEAKRVYETAKEQYESSGYYLRLGEKLFDKPKLIQFEQDLLTEKENKEGVKLL